METPCLLQKNGFQAGRPAFRAKVLLAFLFSAILKGVGVNLMLPYTMDEIKRRIIPVAQKYSLAAVYLFGSYARGDATAESDVDLLVDLTGSTAHGMLLGGLSADLEEALQVSIDLVTVASMRTPTTRRSQLHFRETVAKERLMIYAAA